MDNNAAENPNVLKESNKTKEKKNRANEKLKTKREEKLLKVRKILQEKLTSKLTFFHSLATGEKTPRRKAHQKSVEPVKENTDPERSAGK